MYRLIMVATYVFAMTSSLDAKDNNGLQLIIGEPQVVAIAPQEVGWGYYQFPSLGRWADGTICLTYNMAPDAAESYGKPRAVLVSHDSGKTWEPHKGDWDARGILLENGDRIDVVTPKPYDISTVPLPKPVGTLRSSYGNQEYTMYRLKDLPRRLRTIRIVRFPHGSNKPKLEHAWLDDPLAVRYSLRNVFPIVWWGDMHVLKDGSVIAIVYPGNMVNQDGTLDPKWHVFAYRSADNGRTWKIQGRIIYQPDLKSDGKGLQRDGFTEPASVLLDDGTIICVLRTTYGAGIGPMYLTRSHDIGKTWSKPTVIAPNGVYPRLLKLDNGILVLSSGRPGVQLRFCLDGKGKKWTDPYELVPVTENNPHADTCGYTSLLATGPDSFLIAYSHFKHTTKDGQTRKAILIREVTARTISSKRNS